MSTEVRAGAEAVRQLMRELGSISAQSFTDDFESGDPDPRDYAAMASLVERELQKVVNQSSPAHRQGFARAIAELLCVNFEGCGVHPDDWDPLASSEAAFLAPTMAADAIRRASRRCG